MSSSSIPEDGATRRPLESIRKNQYDINAWSQLIRECSSREMDFTRSVYDRVLQTFPTHVKFWAEYVEAEIRAKDSKRVAEVFEKCLFTYPSVVLWRKYLKFINMYHGGNRSDAHRNMCEAYEAAVKNVGSDFLSGDIWMDYLAYLDSLPTTNHQEDLNKRTQIRKVYQRAVVQPIANIEPLWKRYLEFERNWDRDLAAKLTEEYSKRYMPARSLSIARSTIYEQLMQSEFNVPPVPGAAYASRLLRVWRELIKLEKENKMSLEQAELLERVTYTYRQALLSLCFSAELWVEAALWHVENDDHERAIDFFERASAMLPASLYLHFTYADYLERRRLYHDVRAIYERVLRANDDPLVYVQMMRSVRRMEGMSAARKVFLDARRRDNCTHHVYVQAAMMEFYVNKNDRVAREIFQLGMERFRDQVEFVRDFAAFLRLVNEEADLRMLYEGALVQFSPDELAEVWAEYLDFEYQFGELETVDKLEARRVEMLGFDADWNPMQRYRYGRQWPAEPHEIGLLDTGKGWPYLHLRRAQRVQKKTKLAASAMQKVAKPNVARAAVLDVEMLARTTPGLANVPPVLANMIAPLPPPDDIEELPPDVDFILSLLNRPLPQKPPAPMQN